MAVLQKFHRNEYNLENSEIKENKMYFNRNVIKENQLNDQIM